MENRRIQARERVAGYWGVQRIDRAGKHRFKFESRRQQQAAKPPKVRFLSRIGRRAPTSPSPFPHRVHSFISRLPPTCFPAFVCHPPPFFPFSLSLSLFLSFFGPFFTASSSRCIHRRLYETLFLRGFLLSPRFRWNAALKSER